MSLGLSAPPHALHVGTTSPTCPQAAGSSRTGGRPGAKKVRQVPATTWGAEFVDARRVGAYNQPHLFDYAAPPRFPPRDDRAARRLRRAVSATSASADTTTGHSHARADAPTGHDHAGADAPT